MRSLASSIWLPRYRCCERPRGPGGHALARILYRHSRSVDMGYKLVQRPPHTLGVNPCVNLMSECLKSRALGALSLTVLAGAAPRLARPRVHRASVPCAAARGVHKSTCGATSRPSPTPRGASRSPAVVADHWGPGASAARFVHKRLARPSARKDLAHSVRHVRTFSL